MSYDRLDFAQQLLAELGAPATDLNLRFLLGWMAREGTTAAYNPLATTLAMPGATQFNSVGVRNYPTLQVGVDATARTLRQNNFAAIRADLLDGAGDQAAIEHAELLSWSGGGYDHSDLAPAPGPVQGDADLTPTEAQMLTDLHEWMSKQPKEPIPQMVAETLRTEGVSGAADAAHSTIDDAIAAQLTPITDALARIEAKLEGR